MHTELHYPRFCLIFPRINSICHRLTRSHPKARRPLFSLPSAQKRIERLQSHCELHRVDRNTAPRSAREVRKSRCRTLRQTLSFHEAATLRWTASEGDLPGWDIDYTSSAGLNAIGVKASAGPAFPSIELSSNEWASAKRLGAAYRLMLVAQVRTTSPQIQIIENPAALIEQGRIVIEPVMWRLLMRET